MPPKSKIGKKLKEARKKLKLTQVEVAGTLELHPNYYARIERDEVTPSLETFQEILKLLKLKSSDVLGI